MLKGVEPIGLSRLQNRPQSLPEQPLGAPQDIENAGLIKMPMQSDLLGGHQGAGYEKPAMNSASKYTWLKMQIRCRSISEKRNKTKCSD